MPSNLLHLPRMAAWAAHYGLVKSKADLCLRTVLGKRCLFGSPGSYRGKGYPHSYYNDAGCQAGTKDDHTTLWYLPDTKPTVYVYTFHEYGIPVPKASVSEVDDRGLKHSAHPLSWYSPRTSMHVVTIPQIEEIFPYKGELPRDAQEFVEMYQTSMGKSYPYAVLPQAWEEFLGDHNREYAK